jgi:hypothetical protein
VKYRRRDAERFAQLLADVARHDQRRQRIVRNVHVDADRGCDCFDELLDLDVALVGDEISLAVADVGAHRRHEGVDEVVDVERVIERLAVAEHRERAARDALEDHEEPLRVAGAVDRGGP